MKKLGLFGVLGIVIAIVIAIVAAGNMGKKSPAFVRGKIILDDSLKESAEGVRTLYISIRDSNRPMPPYGAFRKTLRSDPEGEIFTFALTYDNTQRMQETAVWPASFTIKARLDRDGQGGMDKPGDLVGVVENVARGAEGVVVRINTKI